MTIINTFRAGYYHPIVAIDQIAQNFFDKAFSLSKIKKEDFTTFIRTLECFLQITNQKLSNETLFNPSLDKIFIQYAGALFSEEIFEISYIRAYELVTVFRKIFDQLHSQFQTRQLPIISIGSKKPTQDTDKAIKEFKKLKLNPDKVWLWQGWKCESKKGGIYWAPLYPVYLRFGREFTEELHNICLTYYRSTTAGRIEGFPELIKFIEQHDETLDINALADPSFMGRFWRGYQAFYFKSGYERGNKVEGMINKWNNSIVGFIYNYILPAKLFARPFGEITRVRNKQTSQKVTHLKSTDEGHSVSTKLLTDVPLNTTDEEAMEILFRRIQADVDIATNWAEWAANDIWKRYTTRIENSYLGQIVIKGVDRAPNAITKLIKRSNPNHLKNAAATYAHFGHMINKDQQAKRLLPEPLTYTAYELGLPTTMALLPHCTLLVANHPQITPSFLETFQLFDKNGKLTGFTKTNSGHVLVG